MQKSVPLVVGIGAQKQRVKLALFVNRLLMSAAQKREETVKSGAAYVINVDHDHNDSDDRQTITVTGQIEMRVKPTLARVRVVVISEDKRSSRAAQAANAIKAKAVIEALERTAKILVLRTDPTLEPVYHISERNEPPRLLFYRARNVILFETPELDRVGELADAAADIESVQLSDVDFVLDDTTRARLQLEVLARAARNARDKAKVLAEQFEAVVTAVRSVSESVYLVQPMADFSSVRSAYAQSAESVPTTPVMSTVLELRGVVNLTADIRHTNK